MIPAGEALPRISFGAGTSGGLLVSGERDEQRRAVATAIEHGIRHFDCAPIYGHGAAETNLGAVLRELGRPDVLVTSKVNITPEFLATGDLRTCVERSVRASLTRLQRDHLDFLLVHNPVNRGRYYDSPTDPRARLLSQYPPLTVDDYIGLDGVWEATTALREQGLVRRVGLGGMDNDPVALRAALASGLVALFQQPYHLLNPTAALPEHVRGAGFDPLALDAAGRAMDHRDSLVAAETHKVAVSAISPVAAGALTDDAVAGRPPDPVSARDVRFAGPDGFARQVELVVPFAELARESGMSLTELAYRFAMSHPAVTTVVGGFSHTGHVLEAVRYAERGPLPADVGAALADVWITTTKGST
ncbi:hypothetical protein GCM10023175_35150 [Pseudonocardia xishanensis]|uniref:NADP-dependent oxidoreductase domain-containing protein n=1 Tax=Pseudonocardia xishanensis TaxID=630995 RepID=A0ABP8RTJ8_9PSEU